MENKTTLVKRRIDQPIIFNARAVREELKENLTNLEFWTCTIEKHPLYNQSAQIYRRGFVFFSTGSSSEPLQEIINFRDQLENPESPMSQLPIASLTFVLGIQENDKQKEGWIYKKLCEITTGEINPETYKALQLFMVDILLNPDGLDNWFNDKENWKWQSLSKA